MDKQKMPLMLFMVIIMLLGIVYAYQGIAMHQQVTSKEAVFHNLQSQYWSQSKAVRDSAETDSMLNKQLVEIRNFPSELLRLKLIGVGKILTGIFILLFGILIALIIMPVRLEKLLRENRRAQ